MESFVRIVNRDPEVPFIGKYDGDYIAIPAGGEKIVTEDVMRVWMGDPNLTNTGRHNDRQDAYNRICMFHHARGLTGNDPDLLPPLEAYTEDGERIITIMDDPTGELTVPDSTGDSDIAKLQRQIEKLEAQMQARMAGLVDGAEGDITSAEIGGRSRPEGEIRAEIDAEDDDADITTDTPDLGIPSDDPTTVPVGEGGPRKRAPRKAPAKPPAGKPRGTAGTAGRRAAKKAPA